MKYFEAHPVSFYKDKNGLTPEILLVDGNRAAGKTTAFSRMFVEDFLKHKYKFMLVYRYANELTNIAESFFKDIKTLFFPGHEMTDKARAHGAYIELFIDGASCGYAVALNTAGKLKHYSHIFSDVQQMLFDEYQLENGAYLVNEIQKFISLHMTIARGQGKVVRFVPVYMLSNSVSIFNPYYDAFEIADKINSKTKMLRGDGFVLLRLTLKEVAAAQEESAFNRAFSGASYLKSATDNSFLNDENYNIEKISVNGWTPLFCFCYNSETFCCYSKEERLHVKRGGDPAAVSCYGVTQKDRNGDYTYIRTSGFYNRLCWNYQDGHITFADVRSKAAFIKLLFDHG